MRLCGSDMDEHTTVLEAGLGWIVGWKKTDFLGADVLRRQKAGELSRKLAPFEIKDRAIARHGYPVVRSDENVGVVTSGTQTPFLKKSIGLAMVPVDLAGVGTQLDIQIRGRVVAAEVVPEPFYKRPGKA
jgi:aminomethyltransferase